MIISETKLPLNPAEKYHKPENFDIFKFNHLDFMKLYDQF